MNKMNNNEHTGNEENKYTFLFAGEISIKRNFVQNMIMEHKFILPINGGVSLSRINEDAFHILKADNGEKALQILEANKVDAVFWDEGIKELVEMEFEKKVRAMPQHNNIPVIKVHRPYKVSDNYESSPYDTGYYLCR